MRRGQASQSVAVSARRSASFSGWAAVEEGSRFIELTFWSNIPARRLEISLDAAGSNVTLVTDNWLPGKLIEIVGVVDGVDKDFLGHVHVKLRTSNQFMPAMLKLKPIAIPAVAKLQRGQAVVLRCAKMERFAGLPTGDNCTFY
jgi:hypothetical protein